MTDLAERFPIGSRWRSANGPDIRRVVAIEPDHPRPIVTRNLTTGGCMAWTAAEIRNWSRIPDPPPSPITEPVTLHWYAVRADRKSWLTANPHHDDGPAITLLPPGQEPPTNATHTGTWWA